MVPQVVDKLTNAICETQRSISISSCPIFGGSRISNMEFPPKFPTENFLPGIFHQNFITKKFNNFLSNIFHQFSTYLLIARIFEFRTVYLVYLSIKLMNLMHPTCRDCRDTNIRDRKDSTTDTLWFHFVSEFHNVNISYQIFCKRFPPKLFSSLCIFA